MVPQAKSNFEHNPGETHRLSPITSSHAIIYFICRRSPWPIASLGIDQQPGSRGEYQRMPVFIDTLTLPPSSSHKLETNLIVIWPR